MTDYVKLAGRVMDAFKLTKFRKAHKGLKGLKDLKASSLDNALDSSSIEKAIRDAGGTGRGSVTKGGKETKFRVDSMKPHEFKPKKLDVKKMEGADDWLTGPTEDVLRKDRRRGAAEGAAAWGGAGALAAGGGIGAAKLLKKDEKRATIIKDKLRV